MLLPKENHKVLCLVDPEHEDTLTFAEEIPIQAEDEAGSQ
jgi:hypothetical protein